jgi:hypothetical protein
MVWEVLERWGDHAVRVEPLAGGVADLLPKNWTKHYESPPATVTCPQFLVHSEC